MTGPAVDVEQLAAWELWLLIGKDPNAQATPEQLVAFMRLAPDKIAVELAGHIRSVSDLGTACTVRDHQGEIDQRHDLIRRQDAALAAVRELADLFESNAAHEARFSIERTDEGNNYGAVLCSGMALGWDLAATHLRAALASPDTTQEDDRG